jgi:hypothetical protein
MEARTHNASTPAAGTCSSKQHLYDALSHRWWLHLNNTGKDAKVRLGREMGTGSDQHSDAKKCVAGKLARRLRFCALHDVKAIE